MAATSKTEQQRDLAPERWNRLRSLLRRKGVARLQELCEELGVSPATVRRDLEELEALGELRRVHGGAVSTGTRLEEPLFDDKARIASKEKQKIARAAMSLIKPGDTLYLDGGSTLLELARLLRSRTDLTVATNSLSAIMELAGGGPRLIIIGGELRRLSQALVGPLTRSLLQELSFDKAFMGTLGLTLEEGMTTTDPGEAYTKELVMERASEIILLADASKVGKVCLARSGNLDKVNTIITDKNMNKSFRGSLKKMGIELILA